MNLNLVDLSKNIKTEFKGQFNDVISRTMNSVGTTNIRRDMLDIDKNDKDMDNSEFIERLRFLQENKDSNILEDLSRDTGVSVDKVQNIISGLINLPIEFSKERGNEMRECLQIGDKIEINNSGDGPNNYAGMLSSHGMIKELKTKIAGLERLLKEKDELIAAQRETIELLKNR